MAALVQAASAAPRRKLSIRRATIETLAPLVPPTNNLKTRSRSFSELADIFGAEGREQLWLQPLQVPTSTSAFDIACNAAMFVQPTTAAKRSFM